MALATIFFFALGLVLLKRVHSVEYKMNFTNPPPPKKSAKTPRRT